jgi:hypothetical protein
MDEDRSKRQEEDTKNNNDNNDNNNNNNNNNNGTRNDEPHNNTGVPLHDAVSLDDNNISKWTTDNIKDCILEYLKNLPSVQGIYIYIYIYLNIRQILIFFTLIIRHAQKTNKWRSHKA